MCRNSKIHFKIDFTLTSLPKNTNTFGRGGFEGLLHLSFPMTFENQKIIELLNGLKKEKGSYLPRSSPSRSSLRTAPTLDDERRGSWGAYKHFPAKPKEFSPSPRSEEGWGREEK